MTSEWPGHVFGELGVLTDDGEKAQCHACGEFYLHLGSHTAHAHGLRADEYRRVFGLTQRTSLGGPAWLAKMSEIAGEHLRNVHSSRQEQVRTMTTAQRKAEQAKADLNRRGHELAKTPPERMRHALKAKYGTEHGHPDDYIRQVAAMFVAELQNGQRGVYRRMGDRMGTGWSTARSRVMIAINRGFLIWTGTDHEPAGHLPGEQPFDPPGSFDHMLRVEGDEAVPKIEAFEGERLGMWVTGDPAAVPEEPAISRSDSAA